MFELVVRLRDRVVSKHSFDDDLVRIGRAQDNHVSVDNPVFSRQHAVIRKQGPVYTLEDLDTVNGTFVNGKRVRVWNLSNGDTITVGKFTMSFTSDAPRVDLPDVPSGALEGGGTLAFAAKIAGADELERRCPVRAHLVLEAPEQRTVRLERDVVHLGGDARACDVVLGGWLMPARVAMIARGFGGFSIVNVAGKKVLVNDRELEWKTWLREGDRIQVGKLVARFHVGSPVEAGSRKS